MKKRNKPLRLEAPAAIMGGSEVLVVYYIQDEPTPKIGGALPLLSKPNGGDV